MTETTGLALVERALRSGVRIVWDPPRYRGPSEALALVKERPELARELLRRAGTFREQVDAWSRSGRIGAPVLVLPSAPEPGAGACVSCGTPVPAGWHWRCALCRRAVELVLGLSPILDPEAPGQEEDRG